jgi:mono/diheme cytochrome c family protein
MFKAADLKKYAYGGSLCAAVYNRTNPDGEYTKGLTTTQIDALNEYLTAISAAPNAMTSNLAIKWGTKPAFTQNDKLDDNAAAAALKSILKLPGDPKNGAALWSRSCQYCHSIADKKIGPPMKEALKDVNDGGKALRAGSNAMPFYGKDILSDQQCADIIAYVQQQLGK